MMAHNVFGFFVISLIWLVIIGLVGRFVPYKFSRVFLLFVLIVNSWGASIDLVVSVLWLLVRDCVHPVQRYFVLHH